MYLYKVCSLTRCHVEERFFFATWSVLHQKQNREDMRFLKLSLPYLQTLSVTTQCRIQHM